MTDYILAGILPISLALGIGLTCNSKYRILNGILAVLGICYLLWWGFWNIEVGH